MVYLGIDFGTSGARAIIINETENIEFKTDCLFPQSSNNNLVLTWKNTLETLLLKIPKTISQKIKAIAINGTSSTVLLCDAAGNPIDSPILYNDSRGEMVLEIVKRIAPNEHLVCSATSSLAKLFWWSENSCLQRANYFLHQADWLGFLLHGKLGISDYHNALKLGYDVENLCYPDWLKQTSLYSILPKILPPGEVIAPVKFEVAKQFNLDPNCVICTGTTDSIAAFLASQAKHPGEAVTSLGSTLVLKLLSQTPVNDRSSGIYSHRLGNLWLTGGASNTGGAVLKHFFSDQELTQLSQQIDVNQPTNLNYYPLLNPGERFPINDPNLSPKLDPKPNNPVKFLQGLLESIASIETLGYQKLQQLGATPVTQVYTAGGGAKNQVWAKIRASYLNVPVKISTQTDAAYGTALLAKNRQI